MEELLREIIDGKKTYENMKNNYYYYRGKGSKSYVIKRIDLLREQLLRIKKDILED